MTQRQQKIFEVKSTNVERPPVDLPTTRGVKGTNSSKRSFGWWLGGIPAVMTAAMFVWATAGHRILPASLQNWSFPALMGERSGETTGKAELASVKDRSAAAIEMNRLTADSEAEKRAIVIEGTTHAEAALRAQTEATTVVTAGPLQTIQECRTRLKIAAASALANCIGTGVAGGECQARKDIIEAAIPDCGQLQIANSIEGVVP